MSLIIQMHLFDEMVSVFSLSLSLCDDGRAFAFRRIPLCISITLSTFHAIYKKFMSKGEGLDSFVILSARLSVLLDQSPPISEFYQSPISTLYFFPSLLSRKYDKYIYGSVGPSVTECSIVSLDLPITSCKIVCVLSCVKLNFFKRVFKQGL